MHDSKKILIIGGDKRQKELNKILKENMYEHKVIFEPNQCEDISIMIDEADIIILPLPVTKDGINIYSDNEILKISLEEVLNNVRSSQLIIGGLIKDDVKSRIIEKNATVIDFYDSESFITYNSFLTAQGTVYLLLENTDEYVVSRKILITGFGKVGKAVSHFMKVMGLDVYVAARNDAQRSEAMSYGYKALDISDIKTTAYLFDYIVNTVPSIIFDESDVSAIKNECIYIELASAPFGAEKFLFTQGGKNHVDAPSLPGRLYPSASAKAIYKAIEKYL